jgi:undecaprenyl-diphosphatase
VEDLSQNLPLIGAALLAVGMFILIAGILEGRAKRDAVTTRSALLIGLIQAVCLPLRGFSRSGATISTALVCGVERRLAEDFSFALALLVTPPAIGYSVYRLFKERPFQDWNEIVHLLLPGFVGMGLSCAAGYVALHFLSVVLERGRWKYFGFYCLAAAVVVFAFAAYGL